MNLDANQQAAVSRATQGPERLLAITGGAGTGKTTIIRQIVKAMPHAHLVAFAGKAAARASEATGHPASTIHRYMGWRGDALGFTRTESSDPVILDEASMVDSALMAKIVATNPPKLILVGDAAQLPPVGPGQPFHDILRFRPDLVHTLTTCYRASGAIHHASQLVRDGSLPDNAETGGEKFSFFPTSNAAKAHEIILQLAERGQLDPELDLVVCPRNGEPQNPSTRLSLNNDLKRIYSPTEHGEPWRVGDRVINTKNVSDRDWWNGDTGTVVALDTKGHPEVQPDRARADGPIQLRAQELKSLEHAYCLTIHKSQGSQYRRVVVVLRDQDAYQIDRRMVYTAITRACKTCLVIGSKQAWQQGIHTMAQRMTVMQQLAQAEA